MPTITVTTSHSELIADAEKLAKALALPFSDKADFSLILTPDHLGLKNNLEKSQPLIVDFLSGKMQYRQQQVSFKKEAIAKALGLKKGTQPTIVDATAGLARDSFIIASLGFHVTLLERSPIVFALVQDGIRRALLDPAAEPVAKRMNLIQTDAIAWLKNAEKPDIIYLDPMFPGRKKSAAVKKEMQIFQDIIGKDEDADALFETALSCATARVVVKRPRLAVELSGVKPSYSLSGSSSRFDIYLTRNT